MRGLWLGMAVFVGLVGCTSKELVVLLPSEDGRTGKLTVSQLVGDGQVVLDGPLASVQIDAAGVATAVDLTSASLRDQFGFIPDVMPRAPASYVVYFQSGSLDLTVSSQKALQAALEDVSNRSAPELEVIGHTDSVGAAEDNDALSSERAGVVAAMLRANAVDSSVIGVAGRGERDLLVKTGDDVDEVRNRRVQIVVR